MESLADQITDFSTFIDLGDMPEYERVLAGLSDTDLAGSSVALSRVYK